MYHARFQIGYEKSTQRIFDYLKEGIESIILIQSIIINQLLLISYSYLIYDFSQVLEDATTAQSCYLEA